MIDRLADLPRLGVGISGEPGSAAKGIDAVWLRETHPDLVHFYEYGTDVERGLDEHVLRWSALGLPTTYHFLDINLAERDDVDDRWLRETEAAARRIGAAWLCGDAGLWHFGPRDRGHQVLLPPVLCRDSALEAAESIAYIQDRTGFAVLPENPPSVIYLGDLHILDYFALVSERSECGLLLDCAHLAIFQRLRGLPALAGLDGFPLDRVVEMHVAGGGEESVDGFVYVDDSHSPEPLPDTWEIFEYVVERAPNLRAVVYECEYNPPESVLANFERLNAAFPRGADRGAVR
jgi:uncharacterized protein (UPF0276 family)